MKPKADYTIIVPNPKGLRGGSMPGDFFYLKNEKTLTVTIIDSVEDTKKILEAKGYKVEISK